MEKDFRDLRVGGCPFRLSRTTLESFPGSFFAELVSDLWLESAPLGSPDTEVSRELCSSPLSLLDFLEKQKPRTVDIDRDPETFRHIATFLRTRQLFHDECSIGMLRRLSIEAQYFGLDELEQSVQRALALKEEENESPLQTPSIRQWIVPLDQAEKLIVHSADLSRIQIAHIYSSTGYSCPGREGLDAEPRLELSDSDGTNEDMVEVCSRCCSVLRILPHPFKEDFYYDENGCEMNPLKPWPLEQYSHFRKATVQRAVITAPVTEDMSHMSLSSLPFQL